MPHVITVATPELGDRSYVLHDGAAAVVVDPQRDIDRLAAELAGAGVTLAAVAETHVHNDYVSGGLQLSRQAGVPYLVAGVEQVGFEHRLIADGETVRIGSMELVALATPGHTPGHLAYVVRGGGGVEQICCTGGSMLYGSVGRTDLLGAHLADELSRAQFHSVRRLARSLAEDTAVLPTHGFGSFCSSTPPSGAAESTIGEQRLENLACTSGGEDEFVSILLDSLTSYPAYYAEMGPINRAGPPPFPPGPVSPIDPVALRELLDQGVWAIDLRDRRRFAAAHLAGSAAFELGQSFTTYAGWVVPSGARLVLIAERPEDLERARVDLARIGRDGPHSGVAADAALLAQASGIPLARYPVLDFAGLRRELGPGPGAPASGAGAAPVVVLDARRPDEWSAGHLAGARNIFVAELEQRIGEIPPGRVYVHCASGYRASIAASLLQRAGRDVVLVDDDWQNALASGLEITPAGG